MPYHGDYNRCIFSILICLPPTRGISCKQQQKGIEPKAHLNHNNKKHITMAKALKTIALAAASLFLMSCERLSWDDDSDTSKISTSSCNVTLQVSPFTQTAFSSERASRATQPVEEVCSRLTFAVFNAKDGTKDKTVHQTSDDADFGTVSISLPAGTYRVLAIAHNSGKSASVSAADKITFDKNIVTDTFYDYQQIEVDEEESSHNLTLTRTVAMFRLVISDNIPENVKTFKFYYTGGSSTFSAVSGLGSVNSRQTVDLNASPNQHTYEVYTFPHKETDALHMTITALDASGAEVAKKEFTDVPVTTNMITEYAGNFFNGSQQGTATKIQLTVDTEWITTMRHRF